MSRPKEGDFLLTEAHNIAADVIIGQLKQNKNTIYDEPLSTLYISQHFPHAIDDVEKVKRTQESLLQIFGPRLPQVITALIEKIDRSIHNRPKHKHRR